MIVLDTFLRLHKKQQGRAPHLAEKEALIPLMRRCAAGPGLIIDYLIFDHFDSGLYRRMVLEWWQTRSRYTFCLGVHD